MVRNQMITPVLAKEELELIRVWVKGYVSALVDNGWVTEGQDLFYSYSKDWDINIHTCGEPNTIRAVAHPQYMNGAGYIETDMSNWVEIDEYNFKGTRKRKKE